MEQVTVATLKLFGGHWALDFTNTVNSRGARFGPDVLRCYGDLLDWSVRVGVLDAEAARSLRRIPGTEGEAALARAKALREALYRLFAAPAAAQPMDLALLHRALCAAQARHRPVPAPGGYTWSWQADDPDTVTDRIACAAAELLTSSSLARVHVCPGENCAWLFLDTSRPGRRIWCSEETCGTRNRVRRWRDRQRDTPE